MTGSGDFSIYLFADHEKWGTTVINDIRAKVIRNISDQAGTHTSLPLASGKSDMYFRLDKSGTPVQARLYNSRLSAIDFDWGHNHYNNPNKGGDGKTFAKGIVHVQEYHINPDGSIDRISYNARLMSDKEINKYGPVLKHFNPNVKFR